MRLVRPRGTALREPQTFENSAIRTGPLNSLTSHSSVTDWCAQKRKGGRRCALPPLAIAVNDFLFDSHELHFEHELPSRQRVVRVEREGFVIHTGDANGSAAAVRQGELEKIARLDLRVRRER